MIIHNEFTLDLRRFNRSNLTYTSTSEGVRQEFHDVIAAARNNIRISGVGERFRVLIRNEVDISLHFQRMGKFDTLDLFTPEDLMMFEDYTVLAKGGCNQFVDIGANIGLHSLVAKKLGFKVVAYEPDPVNFEYLTKNFELNFTGISSESLMLINSAVGDKSGSREFVRLSDNPFGNHILGAKAEVYGEYLKITVNCLDASTDLELSSRSIVKIDAEGSDYEILRALFVNISRNPMSRCLVFLGDWREECREKIFRMLTDKFLDATNRSSGITVKSIEHLPQPRTSGYVVVALGIELSNLNE